MPFPPNDKPKTLHDDPFYKVTKTATCAAVSGFFSYLTGGSPVVYGTADKICHSVSDAVAEPAHIFVHGESYEDKNRKTIKPS